jgi:hypothetical protein
MNTSKALPILVLWMQVARFAGNSPRSMRQGRSVRPRLPSIMPGVTAGYYQDGNYVFPLLSKITATSGRVQPVRYDPCMKQIRVVDQAGNQQEHEADFLPRIGERIELVQNEAQSSAVTHYYRVKDVMHRLDGGTGNQPSILVEEEINPKFWPA